LCGLCAISSYAQVTESVTASFTLNEVAMLDLEPSNSTVTLNLSSAIEAGEMATVETTNNDQWINFSSAVFENTSRSISINIDGQVPSGINLILSTSKYTGNGKGALGEPVGNGILTLNNTLQTVISNIRGAYTGDGINNGYKLTYSLEIYDYKLLDFNQTATLSITLTLTDSI
ncbi:MAG: hypothetical protein P1P79_12130, partial [Lutibacter sp.]|nr:hypothetical protein [Lutibacter sp.]